MGYNAPSTLPEALQLLAGGDATIVAGGTDYFPAMKGGRAPAKVVDISGVAALRGISSSAEGWSIGAASTWTDIVRADLPPAFDGLKGAAREVGSVQIQNAATIAGNLCNASPAADGVPALLTLNAQVRVQSLGRIRHVPLSGFILGARRVELAPDEMVVAVDIPVLPAPVHSCFLKLGARRYLVISIAMVSVLVSLDANGRIDLVRIAVGSCSAVAQRLGGLEAALIGKDMEEVAGCREIWSQHLAGLAPISDVRGSSQYRLEAVAELCRRAVTTAMKQAEGTVDG